MVDNEMRLEARDLNQQAGLLIKANKIEEARTKIERAIEIDPMFIDSYKNYGDLYMALGEYEEAKNRYKKALLIEKKGEIYFLYGNACFMNDEVHEGLEYYNLAVSAGFDNEDMMFFMGLAYEHLNDDNTALRYFQKACIKNPSRSDFLVKRIATLIRLDLIDSAEEYTDELICNSPELYDGYHIKTQILIHKGLYEDAVIFAKKASDKFPEDTDLLFDYVKAVVLTKKYDEAFKLLEIAKRMKFFEESKRQFLILEAEVAAEISDFERAINCCNQCVELESEEFFEDEARFMLMNLHLAKPDFEKALDQAKAIVAKDAEDMFYYAALYYRAFCTKQMGNVEEAKNYFKEANSIYRLATLENPAAIDVYLYRAMCLKDLEEYDKALELVDFILGVGTDFAEIHILKADIYTIQGRKVQAEAERKKAYELKPELKPETESEGE